MSIAYPNIEMVVIIMPKIAYLEVSTDQRKEYNGMNYSQKSFVLDLLQKASEQSYKQSINTLKGIKL